MGRQRRERVLGEKMRMAGVRGATGGIRTDRNNIMYEYLSYSVRRVYSKPPTTKNCWRLALSQAKLVRRANAE